MTETITQNQVKQLVRFFDDSAANVAISAIADARLSKDGAQLVIEHFDEVKGEMQQAIASILKKRGMRYPVLVETVLLKPVAQAAVPARTKPFVASEFYRNRPGLYVYDAFVDCLDLKARRAVDSAPERPYVASRLKANAYDKDIRKELPETHLSTLEDIAGLIETQRSGKSGFLLNNGYANIFYALGKNGEVFAVDVRWHSDDRRWFVSGWELGGIGFWFAGYQVLFPGNAAL
ncbi:MAG: hypothetical protein KBD65_03395 [Candidatus Moranbacteria bacterium]|nr:hypothetical protein [Candidatus Moranbacteria bacterium]